MGYDKGIRGTEKVTIVLRRALGLKAPTGTKWVEKGTTTKLEGHIKSWKGILGTEKGGKKGTQGLTRAHSK